MATYAICPKVVREAAEEGGVYYRGILLRFIERLDAKVAFDEAGGRVLKEYAALARTSPLGGKIIADWLKMLSASYAKNIEKVPVDQGVVGGETLFIHLAGGIVDNPTLVAWSGGHYQFVRQNMPRVRILDRDQARLDLADPVAQPNVQGVIVMGDAFMGINDSTIVNRSKVADAFNIIEAREGPEVAEALVELARLVVDANNPAAQAVFEGFRKEAAKPVPDKGVLRGMWDGLQSLMAGVGNVAELGVKLAPLLM